MLVAALLSASPGMGRDFQSNRRMLQGFSIEVTRINPTKPTSSYQSTWDGLFTKRETERKVFETRERDEETGEVKKRKIVAQGSASSVGWKPTATVDIEATKQGPDAMAAEVSTVATAVSFVLLLLCRMCMHFWYRG